MLKRVTRGSTASQVIALTVPQWNVTRPCGMVGRIFSSGCSDYLPGVAVGADPDFIYASAHLMNE